MDKPESSHAQVRLFARKNEDEKFKQVVYVNSKLEEFIYLLDVMNSLYDKDIINQPIFNVLKEVVSSVYFLPLFFFQAKMSWNIRDNRNLFFKWKSKVGLHHVVLTIPKNCIEKLTLTVNEMQQLPDIEKTDSKEEISCLKWTIYIGRRKVCVNFQADTDKLNILVYGYWNNLYLKDKEVDLKMTEYQSLLAKRVYLLSYIDKFYKRCIALDEAAVHN